jgi:hypothetical protein
MFSDENYKGWGKIEMGRRAGGMGLGAWGMELGAWRPEKGNWRRETGEWQLATCCWQLSNCKCFNDDRISIYFNLFQFILFTRHY